MNLNATNSSSSAPAVTATPAPAPATPQGVTTPTAPTAPTVTPQAIRGDNHKALPPTKGTELDGEINFDLDADTTPNPAQPQDKPAVETPEPKAEDKDEFDTVPDPVKEALKKLKQDDEPKPADKPVDDKAPTGRKYTGIEEVDKVLKKLPNNTYDAVKDDLPKWYQAFKAQQDQPKFLAAHPEAYTLSPHYKKATAAAQQHRFEAQSVEAALIACKNGEPVKLLDGYSDEGVPIYQTFNPQNGKHDARLEIELQRYYQVANGNLQQSQKALNDAKESYSAWVKRDHEFIEDSFKKLFKDLDPAKFSPQESKYRDDINKLIPDSVTPEHARRIAHLSMVSNLRLAKAFQQYIEKSKAPVVRPTPGGDVATGDTIPLDKDKMFGD
jgi:hypothetical protein